MIYYIVQKSNIDMLHNIFNYLEGIMKDNISIKQKFQEIAALIKIESYN